MLKRMEIKLPTLVRLKISLGIFLAASLGFALGQHQSGFFPLEKERVIAIADLFANSGENELLPTYRNKKVTIPNSQGRPFFHVGIFSSINLGAVSYVFATTSDQRHYVLLTQQIRNVNGKEMVVFEPPAGFFNPPYDDDTPHCVVEYAERKIDLWQRNSQNRNATRNEKKIIIEECYKEAWDQYHDGQLDDAYFVDGNLKETARREIGEETGLNKFFLDRAKVDLLNEEVTKKGVYLARFCFFLEKMDQLPPLKTKKNDEVECAQWICTDDICFTLNDGEEATSAAINGVPVKPYEDHPEMLRLAIEKKIND